MLLSSYFKWSSSTKVLKIYLSMNEDSTHPILVVINLFSSNNFLNSIKLFLFSLKSDLLIKSLFNILL